MGKYKINLIVVFLHERLMKNNDLLEIATRKHVASCSGTRDCEKAMIVTTKNFSPTDLNVDPKKVLAQCCGKVSTLEFARFVKEVLDSGKFNNILAISDKKHSARLERDLKNTISEIPECCKITTSTPQENEKFTWSSLISWLSWWPTETIKRLLPWRIYSLLAS